MNRIGTHIQHLELLLSDVLALDVGHNQLPSKFKVIHWGEHARLLALMIDELLRTLPALERALREADKNQESPNHSKQEAQP